MKPDIKKIYNEHIDRANEKNRTERYKGNESWYHASSAGFCSRKIYFESVEQAEPTNPPNETSKRVMRLGTIVHEDLQSAFTDSIYTNSNTTNSNTKEKEIYNFQKEKFTFDSEGEIKLEEFNVRGFYDLVAVYSLLDAVYLYDFKTISSWGYKLKYGRNPMPNASVHQELQLATYGLWVEKEFGRLDGMYLAHYNKDTSMMNESEVPISSLKSARNFWNNVNEEHKRGLPMFREGVSPVEEWNCRYCQFYDLCKPPYKR